MYKKINASPKNQGFSLIETVVAMLIVSFGLMSISALYLRLQQFNRDAYLQTQATIIAHDMVERMRANLIAVREGQYNQGKAQLHRSCYTSAGCLPSEMAEHDYYEWSGESVHAMTKRLPQGVGCVCIDSTPQDGTLQDDSCDNVGSYYAIKLWWQSSQGKTERFVTIATF